MRGISLSPLNPSPLSLALPLLSPTNHLHRLSSIFHFPPPPLFNSLLLLLLLFHQHFLKRKPPLRSPNLLLFFLLLFFLLFFLFLLRFFFPFACPLSRWRNRRPLNACPPSFHSISQRLRIKRRIVGRREGRERRERRKRTRERNRGRGKEEIGRGDGGTVFRRKNSGEDCGEVFPIICVPKDQIRQIHILNLLAFPNFFLLSLLEIEIFPLSRVTSPPRPAVAQFPTFPFGFPARLPFRFPF